MQQSFYLGSAQIRKAPQKSPSRDRSLWIGLLFLLGAAGLFLYLEMTGKGSHGSLPSALLALLAYPSLPRGLDSYEYRSDSNESTPASGFPLMPILQDILQYADAMLGVSEVSFRLHDESCDRYFSGTVKRNGADAEMRFVTPASSLLHCPWPAAVTEKTISGFQSTVLEKDGKIAKLEEPFTELSQIFAGEFQRLLVGRLQVCGRWDGHIAFCDVESPEAPPLMLQAVQRIVEMAVNGHEHRIVQCNRARSEERQHIARDLHDGAIQSLSAAEMRLGQIRQGISSGHGEDAVEALASAQNLIIREIRKLRLQVECLRKGAFDDALKPRLAELIEDFELTAGISAIFHCDIDEDIVSPKLALELLYFVQEGLSNARKHSGCSRVEITLTGEKFVQLTIQDNGCGLGFTGERSLDELGQCCVGPCVIRERVTANGGSLTITSHPDSGTRLCIHIPVRNRQFESGATLTENFVPDFLSASARKGPQPFDEVRRRSATRTHG